MDAHTQARRDVVDSRVQETPGIDPAAALLIAVTAVLLALALGTGVFLLLPPTL